MNEIDKALERHYQRVGNIVPKKENKIGKTFTKILLSVIFVLASTIYMKLQPENKELFKNVVFEKNLAFTKANEWYSKTFGNILPTVSEPKEVMASSTTPNEVTPYLDGYAVSTEKGSVIQNISSGLFVFQGEKEGYGNTYILQGVDGVDIWYGGIKDSDLSLYDYVDAGTILGVSEEDTYYLVFQKDGQFLSYDEYFKQVSS